MSQASLESRDVATRVQEILDCLERSAHMDYIGEDVSQLEHALQCAELAKRASTDDETILAALLHDIGHFCSKEDVPQMNGFGSVSHEKIGADYLRDLGFSDRVCQLVLGHVEAKRYLVFKHARYAEKVSYASQQTLLQQGGPMDDVEAAAFEQDPMFKEKLRIRQWDDSGKIEDYTPPSLETYRELLTQHLNQTGHSA